MATRVLVRSTPRSDDGFDFVATVGGEWDATAETDQAAKRSMMEYAELMPEPGVGPLRFDDFPFQVEWYSDEVANAIEVVFAKGAQVGACLAPDTRVLLADLTWRRIDEIRPGDEVVAVDEFASDGRGGARRTRRAVVEKKWATVEESVRLTFDDGTEIVASESHRFLWRRRSVAQMRWEPAGKMREGDRIRRVTPSPWGPPDYEDGWYGGMIDGEGSLRMRTPANGGTGTECVVTQNTGPVLDRAMAYMAERGYHTCSVYERPNASGTIKGRVKLARLGEIMRLVGTTRPTRFVDGRCPEGWWWEGRRLPQADGTAWATVVAVEPLGRKRLVDLQTSTGTFIAEGLVSHNSAMGVRWSIRQVDQFSDIGLYVMPTLDDVYEFGDERIEPAIEESPYLQRRILGKFVRNKRLKRIGRGFLHMRGSNSKSGAQSVPATFLFLDEADLLDQTNLPMILRRVTGATQRGKVPRIRWAGYPLLPNTGIDAKWQESDQRVWHVQCLECDTVQPIAWEENVRWTVPGFHEGATEANLKGDPERPLRVMRPGADAFEDPEEIGDVWRQCGHCEASLEDTGPGRKDGALREGQWIAQKPGRRLIGFHTWRGMVPITNLRQLVRDSRRTGEAEREVFSALDLGRAHVGGDARLTQQQLERACSFGVERVEAYYGSNPTTMGIDVAGERDLNVQIDEQLPAEHEGVPNPRRTLWCGRCETFGEVRDLIDRFRCMVVCVDGNPERREAKALRADYPGRVVLVEYDPVPTSDPIVLKSDDAGMPLMARVNRTDAIDSMMAAIREVRQIPLRTPPQGWFAQMRSLVRRAELDTKERPVRKYVKTGSDGDDYAHTCVYALVATELWRTFGQVREQLAQVAGVPADDEEIGFSRVRLDVGAADVYRGGFG